MSEEFDLGHLKDALVDSVLRSRYGHFAPVVILAFLAACGEADPINTPLPSGHIVEPTTISAPVADIYTSKTPLPNRTPTAPVRPTAFTPTAMPPPPEFVQTPLWATRTAMETNHQNFSFVAEAPFTQKIFDEIRKSVVLIEIIGDNNKPIVSSGWFAQIPSDPENGHIITATHGEITKAPKEILLYRPGLNPKERFTVPVGSTKFDNVNDITDLIIPLKSANATVRAFAKGLSWQDGIIPATGKPYLMVGYTDSFFPYPGYDTALGLSYTLGTVFRPPFIRPYGNLNYVPLEVWSGASGSPLITLDGSGKPIVMGMVTKFTSSNPLPGSNSPYFTFFNHLAIGGLK